MTQAECVAFLETYKKAAAMHLEKKNSYREMQIEAMNAYNEESGRLSGYNCSICKNKGDIAVWDDESNGMKIRICKCMKLRKEAELRRGFGNERQLLKYRLDNFTTESMTHKDMKAKAIAYCEAVSDGAECSFYVGGTVGAGKSHLCCGICNNLLGQMKHLVYMAWADDIRRIKADYSNSIEIIERYKTAPYLYIDDFLKGEPTDSEMKAAYEITDYRYRNELPVIISSEKTMRDLYLKDEAIASRLYEMCDGFVVKIINAKNMRIR